MCTLPEIVYVLTNESMEGLVKIGRTTTGVEQRIRELDNTSVPLPFQCFYAGEVENSSIVEGRIHRIFVDKRVRTNREFFRVDPNQVREAIQLAEISDVTPRADVVVDASDLKIPPDSILTFSKDSNVTCTVVANGKVSLDGSVMSPSAAALIALQRVGYNWSSVSGTDYWVFEGETLVARRLRLEDEQE